MSGTYPRLTPQAEREYEKIWKLRQRGMELLDLVSAEFESDPMSVQCFDLRIVEEIKQVSKRYRELVKRHPIA